MTEVTTTPDVQAEVATKFWLDSFKEAVAELEKETTLFYGKGKKNAGGEARKILQHIRNLAKDGREHIQTTKASMKKRTAK